MGEVRDFVVFTSKEDETAAKEVVQVLHNLGLDGDIYENMKFKDLDTMRKDAIAKFIICSKVPMNKTLKDVKALLVEKEDKFVCPVWLSPGKEEILLDQTRETELYGLTTSFSLNGCKDRTDDIEVIQSEAFKNRIISGIKDDIKNEKVEEMKRRDSQKVDFGIDCPDLGGRQLRAENITGSDVLGHEKFAARIVNVMIQNPSFDTPSTIGIFAPWGSGKSRFIKVIKNECRTKPSQLYIKTTKVNCCLVNNKISWCTKLFILTLLALLITFGTVAIACALVYQEHVTQKTSICADNISSLESVMGENTTVTINASTLITACPDTNHDANHFLDGWTYAAIGICILLLLVLSMSCCQRKVCHDISVVCRDCCCLADSPKRNENGKDFNTRKESQTKTSRENGQASSDGKHDEKKGLLDDSLKNTRQEQNTENNGGATNFCCFTKKTDCGQNCCLDSRTLCFMSFFEPPEDTVEEVYIISVDFNAWEYSGCDFLWAGIVTTLGSEVENYFGSWKVRLCRLILSRAVGEVVPENPRSYAYVCCKMRHKFYIVLLLSFFVLVIATTLLIIVGLEEGADSFKESYVYWLILSSVTAFCVLTAAFASVTKAVVKSTKSFVDDIRKEMVGEDFKQELGFMHKVKEEVHHISRVINFMSRLYGHRFRVLLSIDDLDRCSPRRIMGILEAVNLLLEPENDNVKSPYISILAIDPRVVLGAIERHFDPDQRKDYTLANVNGYEYLKKIIHMPFCLPIPTAIEKANYIDDLLKNVEQDSPKNESELNGITTKDSTKSTSNVVGAAPKLGPDEAETDIDAAISTQGELNVRSEPDQSYSADALLIYLKEKMKQEQLLSFIHGNPRTLKRICNILLLALGVFQGEMTRSAAFTLMLVVLMVEQWPFRTSFLRQFYLGEKQKSIESFEESQQLGDLTIKIHPKKDPENIQELKKKELVEIWTKQKNKVLKVDRWKKFLSYDYDPELFYAFITTYRLCVYHLEKYIPYAVNHDTNIESIVEQGLAELDLKEDAAVNKVMSGGDN